MTSGGVSRQIRLAARPVGEPVPGDFATVEVPVPRAGEGEVLVRNTWLSVDPYMRGRMNAGPSYLPAFEVGEPMEGGAVGEVVESRSARVPVGAVVLHNSGWREHAVLDGARARVLDTTAAPPEAHLGPLGMVGLTAYAGLVRIAPVREGDVVFVSAAAGGVGTAAARIARHLGASRIVGSAGGPEKARRLVTDFGYDAGLDYKAGGLSAQLKQAAPDGIDVYLDNVGGDHLRAAISRARLHARFAICGAISTYNATTPQPGPDNLALLIGKRLTLRGYLVFDHGDLAAEYAALAAGWLADGSLPFERTVVDGFDHTVDAFLGLLRGENTGKMLVRL